MPRARNVFLPSSFNENSTNKTIPVSIFNNNLVRVHFPTVNYTCYSMLDTGSAVNVISRVTLEKIFPKRHYKMLPTTSIFRSVSNQPVKASGKIELRFKIGEHMFKDYFYVFDNDSHNIILGVPFLKVSKAMIDYNKLSLLPPSTWRLHALDNVQLKPRSSLVLPTRLSNKTLLMLSGVHGIVEQTSSKSAAQVMTSVSTTCNGKLFSAK